MWWLGANSALPEPWKKSFFDCLLNKGKSTVQAKASSSPSFLFFLKSGLSVPYFFWASAWDIRGQGDLVIFLSGKSFLTRSVKRVSVS